MRRFSSNPGLQVLALIEGVAIIDQTPVGVPTGIGSGFVALVGEFADMSSAVAVAADGSISTRVVPTEIFSGPDLAAKAGGFDPTLGDFGVSDGNGIHALRNKRFSRYAIAPVNLASARGLRAFRQLPTNASATNPTPAVPMQAAALSAGTEFKNAANRVRTAAAVGFQGAAAFAQGTDGTVLNGVATPGVATTGVGPFDFRAIPAGGHQIVAQFNAGGAQNFDVTAVSALSQASSGENYNAGANDWVITLKVDGGELQTITIHNAADVNGFLTQFNTQVVGATALLTGGTHLKVQSGTGGTGSIVQVVSVTNTLGVSGLTAGVSGVAGWGTAGSGTVANSGAVTAAELAAIMAAITNGTATAVGGALVLTSTTTGNAGTATFTVASTAGARLGGDAATNVVNHGLAAGGAATQTFSSASADFVADGAKVGDALVVGVIGAAGAQGTNAATYRVTAVTDANDLVVERQDGASFAFVASAALAWRLHPALCADSAAGVDAADASYTVPARPLDATIAQNLVLTPTVAPPAPTATTWDTLSGLGGRSTSNASGIVFAAALQAPNAASSTSMDAAYQAALDALLAQKEPQNEVNIVWGARTSANIRKALELHAIAAAASQPQGRVCVIAPEVNVVAEGTVFGDVSPGVGTVRDERTFYSWPGVRTLVPEAIGTPIKGADGSTVVDGTLDVRMDGWLASLLSVLAPFRNPGELTDTVKAAFGGIVSLQRGAPDLEMADYVRMKQLGIAGVIHESGFGYAIQSGVTTSLVSGRANINRRRMADYVQGSLSNAVAPYSKQPLTDDLKDSIDAAQDAFLDSLLSPNNKSAQQIAGYVFGKPTTTSVNGTGIYTTPSTVEMLDTADVIVLQTTIGFDVLSVTAA